MKTKFSTDITALAILIIYLVSIVQVPCTCDSNNNPEPRIIGGSNAKEGEFPHQIQMRWPSGQVNHICGGSILTPEYILLAAHCVSKRDATTMQIIAGQTDVSAPRLSGTPSQSFIHPCWNQEDPTTNDNFNDIAMLKLQKPLTLNANTIKTITIDNKDLAKEGTKTKAIGWGNISPQGPSSGKLQKATFKVTTSAACLRPSDEVFGLVGRICTDGQSSHVCNGDSGGPLLCDDGGINVVCGLASFAISGNYVPCMGNSIYTRVFHYQDWISDILGGANYSDAGCIGQRYVDPPKGVVDVNDKETDEDNNGQGTDKNNNDNENGEGTLSKGSSYPRSITLIFLLYALVLTLL